MDKSAPTLTWDSTNRWGCAECGPSLQEPCIHWKNIRLAEADPHTEDKPSKWALERACPIVEDYFGEPWGRIACKFDAIRLWVRIALEFDVIALESERNVCQILRGENSSTAAREPLRISDAMDSYRDAIARERDEVAEKLEEFLEKLNGKIQTAGAERILANNFGELAIYFSGDEIRVMRKALAAYRERMGR